LRDSAAANSAGFATACELESATQRVGVTSSRLQKLSLCWHMLCGYRSTIAAMFAYLILVLMPGVRT
jgi:hypothetical protein